MAEKAKVEDKPVKPNPVFFLIQLVLAILIQAVIFYGGYLLCDRIPVPASMDYGTRFAYTFRWTFPMVLVLLVTIQQTANRRGTTAAGNPLAGMEHLVQVFKNIVTNTLEQLMVSLLLMLTAVTYCDTPDWIKIIPIYAITFTVGRILFIIGYRISPLYRVTGILINFFSSFALAGYVSYQIYTRGMMYGLGNVYTSAGGGGAGKDEL